MKILFLWNGLLRESGDGGGAGISLLFFPQGADLPGCVSNPYAIADFVMLLAALPSFVARLYVYHFQNRSYCQHHPCTASQPRAPVLPLFSRYFPFRLLFSSVGLLPHNCLMM